MAAQGVSSTNSVSFGVGCFTFEVPDEDHMLMFSPGTYSVHDWARDVEAALRELPSLDSIEVDGFRSVRGDSPPSWRNELERLIADGPHESTHKYGDFQPHPSVGRIKFDVTIPTRTQEQVFNYVGSRVGASTVFSVDIHYDGGMPVAYIRPAAVEAQPSTSVAVVREFLRSEFDSRLKDNKVKFAAMGPSPMWAEWSLRVAPVTNGYAWEIDVDSTRPGYAAVEIIVDSSSAANLEVAFESAKFSLSQTLADFYHMIGEQNMRRMRRRFIEVQIEALIKSDSRRWPLGWFHRLFRGSGKANSLTLEILAGKLDEETPIERQDKAGPNSPIRHLDYFFSQQASAEGDSYLENAHQIVSLLSTRYSHIVQVASVIVASLIGGLAGAAITALVQLT